MTLKLDDFFIATVKNCNCKSDNPQPNADGYIFRTICQACHGKGIIHQKVSLIDLKAWLDGYGG